MKKYMISLILFMLLLSGCEDKKVVNQTPKTLESPIVHKSLTVNESKSVNIVPMLYILLLSDSSPSANQTPIAKDDNVTIVSGENMEIYILLNDSESDVKIDQESVKIITQTTHGTVELNTTTGVFTYYSDSLYIGEDSFTYEVSDYEGAVSNIVTVNIVVAPPRLPKREEENPSNWYIRLVAADSARKLTTESAQLGQLDEEGATVKHTLKAFNPFGGEYIDIIFRNPDGVNVGDYKVNYHPYEEGVEDSWSFVVRTNDENADISLSWLGLYVLTPYVDEESRLRYSEYQSLTNPLLKNMKLIDSSSGEEIKVFEDGNIQSYLFNMRGQKERLFEWVVAIDEVLIEKSKRSIRLEKSKVIQNKKIVETTFDINRPPMVEMYKGK